MRNKLTMLKIIDKRKYTFYYIAKERRFTYPQYQILLCKDRNINMYGYMHTTMGT